MLLSSSCMISFIGILLLKRSIPSVKPLIGQQPSALWTNKSIWLHVEDSDPYPNEPQHPRHPAPRRWVERSSSACGGVKVVNTGDTYIFIIIITISFPPLYWGIWDTWVTSAEHDMWPASRMMNDMRVRYTSALLRLIIRPGEWGARCLPSTVSSKCPPGKMGDVVFSFSVSLLLLLAQKQNVRHNNGAILPEWAVSVTAACGGREARRSQSPPGGCRQETVGHKPPDPVC